MVNKLAFSIDDSYKDRIINNLDDIELTLRFKDEIKSYESKMRQNKPWLFGNE